ncbi:MAG TPA: MFS transporter [Rhizomicrobium sp.]|jgi:MFS family permease|nr:MFS transporter [Rhizomicrobium sp.]
MSGTGQNNNIAADGSALAADAESGTVDAAATENLVGTPPDEPLAEQEIADIVAPRRSGLLSVFRHRNYRLFFTGQLVSLMGSWMQNTAQPWLVYDLTHSKLLLGVVSFCSTVPVFFITPFGGMVADRVDRRKFLLVTQSAAMLQAAVLATLTLLHMVQVWEIICLALTMGLINAFDVPTRQTMTLDMVGREDLRHAISLNSMMFNAARVVGPSLAGALIALVGEGICFALNAVSFAAVLVSLFLMRLAARPPRVNSNALREVIEGYRYSFANPQIRLSLILVAVSSLFGAAYLTMMPAVVRDLLHGSSTANGTLLSAIGAGALGGAFVLSRVTEKQLTYLPVAAALAFGIGLVAFSHSHMLWLSVLIVLPTSASLMLLGGTTNTIIQMAAAEDFRGRVISHYTQSFMGMMPWGALLLGAVASRYGVTDAISLGGVVVGLSAVYGYYLRRNSGFALKHAPAE